MRFGRILSKVKMLMELARAEAFLEDGAQQGKGFNGTIRWLMLRRLIRAG
jgi:hypothetical protein